MRRKRECYLLIREIRVASAWEAMDGRVFRRRRDGLQMMCGIRGHGVGRI
jgi:hypothetical protein